MTNPISNEYLMKQLLKAKEIAICGVNFDSTHCPHDAIKCYDEAILILDEVLSQIQSTEEVWKLLMEYRERYSSRIVIL